MSLFCEARAETFRIGHFEPFGHFGMVGKLREIFYFLDLKIWHAKKPKPNDNLNYTSHPSHTTAPTQHRTTPNNAVGKDTKEKVVL